MGIIYLSTVLSCVSNIRLQHVLYKRDYNNDVQLINALLKYCNYKLYSHVTVSSASFIQLFDYSQEIPFYDGTPLYHIMFPNVLSLFERTSHSI